MSTFGQPLHTNSNEGAGIPIKYLDFSGKEGLFFHYDKETKEKKKVMLGEMIILNIGYKIQGWSDKHGCMLYSNESSEWKGPFNIKKTADKSTIFEGDYAQSKDTIQAMGGKLHYSITVLSDGFVYNLSLKGMAYKSANDFINALGNAKNTNYVEIAGTDKAKKGGVEFFVPKFKIGNIIEPSDVSAAQMVVESLYSNTNNDGESI